jgi:hypothetical protein
VKKNEKSKIKLYIYIYIYIYIYMKSSKLINQTCAKIAHYYDMVHNT